MPALVDTFELGRMELRSGEGRRLELCVGTDGFVYGDQRYHVTPDPLVVTLDASRLGGHGYSLRLRFHAALEGPCMRCLEDAAPEFDVDAREVDEPGEGEELDSPYVDGDVVDLRAWAHDALALALPDKLLCRADCAGLCPQCGENLNTAGPDHQHEREPDPRWAKLRELKFE
jgi:uncharacterized protein